MSQAKNRRGLVLDNCRRVVWVSCSWGGALWRGEGSEVVMGRDQVVEVHTVGVEWLHKHLDQGPGYKGHLQAKRLWYGRITLALLAVYEEEVV